MAFSLKTKLAGKRTKLAIGAVVAVLVVTGTLLLVTQRSRDTAKQLTETVTILPVPEPKEGERLRDIPASDTQKRSDFVRASASLFGIKPNVTPTPEAIAKVCVSDGTAQVTSDARALETYRNDTEKIKADILAVNKNCYAKYAETDYVAPAPGPAHVHPDTLQH